MKKSKRKHERTNTQRKNEEQNTVSLWSTVSGYFKRCLKTYTALRYLRDTVHFSHLQLYFAKEFYSRINSLSLALLLLNRCCARSPFYFYFLSSTTVVHKCLLFCLSIQGGWFWAIPRPFLRFKTHIFDTNFCVNFQNIKKIIPFLWWVFEKNGKGISILLRYTLYMCVYIECLYLFEVHWFVRTRCCT